MMMARNQSLGTAREGLIADELPVTSGLPTILAMQCLMAPNFPCARRHVILFFAFFHCVRAVCRSVVHTQLSTTSSPNISRLPVREQNFNTHEKLLEKNASTKSVRNATFSSQTTAFLNTRKKQRLEVHGDHPVFQRG